MSKRLRVLVLDRTHPNAVTPNIRIWTEVPTRLLAESCDVQVVAPLPYCPPLPTERVRKNRGYRAIPRREERDGVVVHHPRYVRQPSAGLFALQHHSYMFSVVAAAARIRRAFPFDLVHARFVYPDGVAAAALGRRYRVPYVISEHAPWKPWLDDPRFRRRAVPAAAGAGCITAVSSWARETMRLYIGDVTQIRIVPGGVDPDVFALSEAPRAKQVLYAGTLRSLKAVDMLIRSMRHVLGREPHVSLVVAGADLRGELQRLRSLAADLGLEEQTRFVGPLLPAELAELMGRSAVLVLPSRRETFGKVLVEALACGTPVVATRPGGPEDIVTGQVGKLVEKDDPEALAAAILGVLSHPEAYEPQLLRAYALEHFSWHRAVDSIFGIYEEIMNGASRGDHSGR